MDQPIDGSTDRLTANRQSAEPPIRPSAHPPFLPVLIIQALTLLLLWLLQARYG